MKRKYIYISIDILPKPPPTPAYGYRYIRVYDGYIIVGLITEADGFLI